MKKSIGICMETKYVALFIALLLPLSLKAQAATTVTVDNNDKIVVTQPSAIQPVVTETVVQTQAPVIVTREAITGDFEGRIVGVDYSRNQILVLEADGSQRQTLVRQEAINSYRVGDYVLVHPTTDLTVITLQENPRDFEGDIIRVEISKGQIIVLDTNGRERRVQLKQGMIGTYKVDDYVRIHLMADLKEAKTMETIGDMRKFEGNVVSVDALRSQIVVRDTHEQNVTVWVRQGLINNYSVGQHVRIYTLVNHDEAQLIRIVR